MYALFRRRSNELCGRDHRCPDGGYQYWQLEEQQWFAVTSTHVGAKVQVPYQLSSTSVPERPRGTLRSYMWILIRHNRAVQSQQQGTGPETRLPVHSHRDSDRW
jgi:hypothetical protein